MHLANARSCGDELANGDMFGLVVFEYPFFFCAALSFLFAMPCPPFFFFSSLRPVKPERSASSIGEFRRPSLNLSNTASCYCLQSSDHAWKMRLSVYETEIELIENWRPYAALLHQARRS
jgi:hypothetical protein